MLQLKKFPELHVSPREEARESRRHPEEPRFRLLAREEGSFPFVLGKEFTAFPSHLKGRCYPQERREELQGHATIPRVPQMPQSNRLTTRWHVIQPCGKASWESLVGKSHGKAWRQRHKPLDPREGKRDSAATARKESARACPPSRRGLIPLGRLQKYPNIHVCTGEESSGSGTDSTQGLRPWHRWERNPRDPRATRMGTGLS